MYLSWIEMTDVRCYQTLRFEPDGGINVLVGANGAGKTSILEAVASGEVDAGGRYVVLPVALVRLGRDCPVADVSLGYAGAQVAIQVEGRRL